VIAAGRIDSGRLAEHIIAEGRLISSDWPASCGRIQSGLPRYGRDVRTR